MADEGAKKKKSKNELEPYLTDFNQSNLNNYRESVVKYLQGRPDLKIDPKSIKIQFVSKCLNRGLNEVDAELCILPLNDVLHHFNIEKRKLSESDKKNILFGSSERDKKKHLSLVCPISKEVVAVRIKESKTKKRKPDPTTDHPPPEIIIVDSDDENYSRPTRRDPQKRKIKQEPGVEMPEPSINKRKKKTK